MTATQQITKTALWVPGWYELDQTLTVGVHDRFWFYQNPPVDMPSVESFDFVFFNQVNSAAHCQVRTATIFSINHSILGAIRKIDTDGLDYVFYPESMNEFVVNAEENPGSLYDNSNVDSKFRSIDDWTVSVTLGNVSEPVSDFV